MHIKKRSFEDIIVSVVVYVVMIAMALVMLIPFLNVVSKAFSEEWAIISGRVGIIPVGFQLDTMKYVLTQGTFLNSFVVSLFVTIFGTACNMCFTVIAAYVLSKRNLPGLKIIMFLFVFTMLFNAGMVPNYLLVRNLGLLNNLLSLILPTLINVYNMLIIKNYFESLPISIEESAQIDGARSSVILFRIVLPMSAPVLATITLFYAVGHWNDYFRPMLFISKQNLKPLQLYLRDIILEATAEATSGRTADELANMTSEGVRSATVVASTVPILCVYPFLQKYFIKGILIGSVKG